MPIRVLVHIDAPIDRVFYAISDHETFICTADGTKTRLLREGATERNGLGCVREVTVGTRVRYVEEITAWQRPSRFEYTIRETTLPLRHRGSGLSFTESRGGTDVEWTARFDVAVPVIGRVLRGWLDRRLARAFREMLDAAKERLEAEGP